MRLNNADIRQERDNISKESSINNCAMHLIVTTATGWAAQMTTYLRAEAHTMDDLMLNGACLQMMTFNILVTQ